MRHSRKAGLAGRSITAAGLVAAVMVAPATVAGQEGTQARPQPQTRPQVQSRPAASPQRRSAPQVEAVVDGDPIVKLIAKDRIEPVDAPEMVTAAEAAAFMSDAEMVLGVVKDGQARAYSTWYLDQHEVVNDRVGETPITATW